MLENSSARRKLIFSPGKRTTRQSRKQRPLTTYRSLHVVLKSDLARGKMNLRKHESKIEKMMRRLGKSHGVHIYKIANVGNHIHINLRVTRKIVWKKFITGLTGGIARAVGFSRKVSGRGFWNSRPFSRAVGWGFDFAQLQDYFTLNLLEADGIVPRHKRDGRRPRNWRRIVHILTRESGEMYYSPRPFNWSEN